MDLRHGHSADPDCVVRVNAAPTVPAQAQPLSSGRSVANLSSGPVRASSDRSRTVGSTGSGLLQAEHPPPFGGFSPGFQSVMYERPTRGVLLFVTSESHDPEGGAKVPKRSFDCLRIRLMTELTCADKVQVDITHCHSAEAPARGRRVRFTERNPRSEPVHVGDTAK